MTLPQPAQAAGATIYFSPSAGTFQTDSTFEVGIFVNTGGQSVNAVEVNLHFPADKLQVISPSVGNSFVSIWVQAPTYNNSTGTVNLSGGLPNPGIKSSAALITTISFRTKSSGTAKLTFDDSSKVLANDGNGTNILSSRSPATFTLKATPPAGPVVTSDTHPDSNTWYKQSSVSLSWEKGDKVTDFSYEIDQDPATVPDETSEGAETSKSYENVPDGLNYFHLRAKGQGGWGGTTHFLVRIDTTGPAKFNPTLYPSVRTARSRPILSFFTTDAASGIDHYEIRIIDSDKQDVTFFTEQSSPYQLPELKVGKYTVVVRAIDQAGNMTDEPLEIEILPKVLPFNEDVVSFLEALPITNLVLIALILASLVASVVIRLRRHRLGLAGKVSQDVAHIQSEVQALQAREDEIERLKREVQSSLQTPPQPPPNKTA